MARSRIALIGAVALLACALFAIGAAAQATDPPPAGTPADVSTVDPAADRSVSADPRPGTAQLWVLSFAMLVGSIGSAAFLVGVWLGFITRGSRGTILEFLARRKATAPPPPGQPLVDQYRTAQAAAAEEDSMRWWRAFVFCLFGGLVATIFQWAQPEHFIPIQAFVLGATWPSVVTRVMAGGDSAPPITPLTPGGPTPVAPPKPDDGAADASQPPAGQVVIP